MRLLNPFKDIRGKVASQRVRLLVLFLLLAGLLSSLTLSSERANAATGSTKAVELTNLTMINQRSGWALDMNQPDHVYVTQQGPEHWTDVTPSVLTSRNDTIIISSAFPDATHGYLGIIEGANSSNLLLSTSNGGKSWQTTSFPALDGLFLLQINFLDAQHGWLNFGAQIHLDGASVMTLLRTSDGGKSWQTILDSSQGTGGLNPAYFQSTHVTFADSQHGWATGMDPTGAVYLYSTHDGGTNWSKLTVASIKGNGVSFAWSYGPYWLSSHVGTLYVHFDTYDNGGYPMLTAFQTYDGGQHWVLGPASPGTSYQDLYSSSYLDARFAWSFGFDGQGQYALHATSTGGRPWTTFRPTGLLTPDAQNQVIGDLSFINPITGWIFIKDIQGNWHLFQSDNGGHTWHALHPVVG